MLMRNGITETSISQIAAECRLSVGAIYANFENKADLARYVATRLFDWRISELEALANTGTVPTPATMLGILLASLSDEHRPEPSVILQFWSEASVDDDLREVLAEQVGRLVASVERALRPWADAQAAPTGATSAGGEGGEGWDLARRTAQTLLVMCQGFLANRCLFGWLDAEDYLATATAVLGNAAA